MLKKEEMMEARVVREERRLFLEELSEGMHHAGWGGSRTELQKCQSTQF